MMDAHFPLAPRYRLDDEQPWLRGIDPNRRYWLWVNGNQDGCTTVPGLSPADFESFKETILRFRQLQPGESLELGRIMDAPRIHCISSNCYAIATTYNDAPVWHLFDHETLESLLMTAHPDWQCSAKDVDLGREWIEQMFIHSVAA
jgi:hypothetical protein